MKILLCSDLDRTLLPNGEQPESPLARPLLRSIAQRTELTLAYVSGRHKELLLEAIREYELPVPQYAIGDVGTTIYEIAGTQWIAWQAWQDEIALDWKGHPHEEIGALFDDLDALTLQAPDKQNTFKLSYFTPQRIDHAVLINKMQDRLETLGIRASLIWSVDEQDHTGLLDVLPQRATKYHAIRFLMANKGFPENKTVFAGDSGNDLPVLTSGLQAVLVRNAHADVREIAIRSVGGMGKAGKLYVAQGEFHGLNGNYAAGVMEGLAHFLPETRTWFANTNL